MSEERTTREILADNRNALTYSQEEMMRGAAYLVRAALQLERVVVGDESDRLAHLDRALDAIEDALFAFHGTVAS